MSSKEKFQCSACNGTGEIKNFRGVTLPCDCNPKSPFHKQWAEQQRSVVSQSKKVEIQSKEEQAKPCKKATKLVTMGKAEMNLTEIALVDWGAGRSKQHHIISRRWRYLDGTEGWLEAITAPEIGLPTPPDLDLRTIAITMACEHKTDPVSFDGADLMNRLGRPKEGWAYKQTRKGFERWRALGIQQWSGWYNQAERKRVITGGWSVIDAWRWPTKQEIVSGADPQAWFSIGAPLRQSIQSGYIRHIDLDAYWSIQDIPGRFMFGYADRHLYGKCEEFSKPNEFIYGVVLGLEKQNHSPVAIARHLEHHLRELPTVGIEVEVSPRYTTFARSTNRSKRKKR